MTCEELRLELLDVLYGEAEPEVRRRVDAHLEVCPACRQERQGLEGVRRDLREWRLPDSLMPGPARVAPASPLAGLWRLAAAAVLLLALGAAVGLSGLSFRFERGPVTVQLGRAPDAVLLARLEAQEERYRAEMAELRRSLSTAVRPVGAPGPSQEALLEQVARMIDASESRQQSRLETAWADISQQAEAQRRFDLARISAGLSYLDSKSGAQAARTSELVSYLIEASDRR
jgi:anti-sigma factor RsiW